MPFLRILDGGPCSVGIEPRPQEHVKAVLPSKRRAKGRFDRLSSLILRSTVVKLDTTCSVPCLRLLRRGGVTEERLEEFLKTSRGRFRAPIQLVARRRKGFGALGGQERGGGRGGAAGGARHAAEALRARRGHGVAVGGRGHSVCGAGGALRAAGRPRGPWPRELR